MSRFSWCVFAVLAAVALQPFAVARAQPVNYPTKPVTLIIAAAAGNSPDVATRIVADALTQLWKQQVLVINRPGAGGLIAGQAAAAADKDGYTLYMAQASTYTVLPITQTKLPFDLDKDFTPISLVVEQPIAISVPPSLGIITLKELMDKIKQTPGGMFFAASNRGGQSHLTGELFKAKTGLDLTFVHAAGAATSINDVTTGRIPIMFEGIAGVGGAIQGGTLKALAIASPKRLPNMPELPTFAETVPGFESKGWQALMAPAGVSDAIIQKINADLRVVLAQPDVIKKFEALGSYPHPMTPQETTAFLRAERDLWWPIVRKIESEAGNEKK
jgi:tripartite-type tricarboxylate transporter receptor subunit TctC